MWAAKTVLHSDGLSVKSYNANLPYIQSMSDAQWCVMTKICLKYMILSSARMRKNMRRKSSITCSIPIITFWKTRLERLSNFIFWLDQFSSFSFIILFFCEKRTFQCNLVFDTRQKLLKHTFLECKLCR